jgi:hypothetical protein
MRWSCDDCQPLVVQTRRCYTVTNPGGSLPEILNCSISALGVTRSSDVINSNVNLDLRISSVPSKWSLAKLNCFEESFTRYDISTLVPTS